MRARERYSRVFLEVFGASQRAVESPFNLYGGGEHDHGVHGHEEAAGVGADLPLPAGVDAVDHQILA